MYHMYDADIALPVVGEEGEHGRVWTGRAVQCPVSMNFSSSGRWSGSS